MKKGSMWVALLTISLLAACQSEAEKARKLPLYDRLGQEAQITAIVDDFVARVAVDSRVNFTRRGTPAEWHPTPENVAKLKAHLVDFIVSAVGGPKKYEGRDIKSVHAGMQITNAQFTFTMIDMSITLDKFNIVDPTKQELMDKIEATRKDIVTPEQD
jgi:hemoglobin